MLRIKNSLLHFRKYKFNRHGTCGEKCVEIVKSLHVIFLLFGHLRLVRIVIEP